MSQAATTKPAPAKPAAAAKPPAKTALPPAVEAAFKKSYPNATIKNVSKEKEGGRDVYEVESIDGGLARDLNYLADATVIEIEETITAADVPPAALAALAKRYGTAKVTKRERITQGSQVSFEFQLTGAKVKEAVIAPDGTFISPK